MNYIDRALSKSIEQTLTRGKSILLLGARQTGKTTLIQKFPADFTLSFVQPAVRQRYERNPALLTGELEALAEDKQARVVVWIDEVQKVPAILDTVQDLIDHRIAQFILTGSSARKLRVGPTANWLPGRVVSLRLDPLMLSELKDFKMTLEDCLLYGTLPGIIVVSQPEDKEIDLASYVTGYLEEEIRSEALVKNVGQFARFTSLNYPWNTLSTFININ